MAGAFDEASETRRGPGRNTAARPRGDRGRSCKPPSFGLVERRKQDAPASGPKLEMLLHSDRDTWQRGLGGIDRATVKCESVRRNAALMPFSDPRIASRRTQAETKTQRLLWASLALL